MNWLEILRIVLQGALLIVTGLVGMGIGARRMQSKMMSAKLPAAPSRDSETLVTHEAAIDGDALRFTVRTPARVASFLVPKEQVYQMSDDLLRAAASLGKREQVQRGPE